MHENQIFLGQMYSFWFRPCPYDLSVRLVSSDMDFTRLWFVIMRMRGNRNPVLFYTKNVEKCKYVHK